MPLFALTVVGGRAILRPMRALSVITLLAVLILPTVAFAETQTFTATHTYILGDHDSKDDARQRCLLEAKRKVLEQAGVYIESASEVKDFDLTKDKITSFAAAVMQIKDTKEAVGFENGHMTLTLALTASVDSAEVQTLLAARHVDINMQERLKRLEAQLEAMQRQQGGQSTEQTSAAPPNDISAEELQALRMQAAQGDAKAQTSLGFLYYNGKGIPQDYEKAREWLEIAAAQGYAAAQGVFGVLYMKGHGVPRDNVRAYMWFNLAALHLTGRPQEASAELRNRVSRMMTTTQIAEAQRLAQQCEARQFKGC